jgi:hypothetical protein
MLNYFLVSPEHELTHTSLIIIIISDCFTHSEVCTKRIVMLYVTCIVSVLKQLLYVQPALKLKNCILTTGCIYEFHVIFIIGGYSN